MAVRYTYRCPVHGDFDIEQQMSETTPTAVCNASDGGGCGELSPKVLGGHIQFTYGRDNFHSGPDGTGETVRETARRWHDDAVNRGLTPEPVGYRHF